jgi:endonuclease YncB( thermonuclease family)
LMRRNHAGRLLWLALAAILLLPGQGTAHRGRLDSLGCHPSYSRVLDGATAGYHCHWGTLSGRSFASKEEALEALQELREGSTSASSKEVRWRTVTGIADGGAITLDGEEEVALLGVDLAESADRASGFIRRMMDGEKARLEYDQETSERDGLTMAYVYSEAGILLNSEIIRQGHARAATDYSFRLEDEFRRYEREARKAGRGLWGKSK